MEIVTYDQVPDKSQLLPLHWQGFASPFDPREFEQRRHKDYRLANGPVAFCAVEDGRLVSIVGIMDIPTRTLNGEETVGGIWGVITDPAYAGRGIARRLMDAAHQHFRSRGYRFAMLTTWRSWLAHGLYERMGYFDIPVVTSYPRAFRLLDIRGKNDPVNSAPALDLNQIAAVFERFTRDRTGFVLRHKDYLKFRLEQGRIDQSQSVQADGGYALISENRGFLVVEEVAAANDEALDEVLATMEERAQRGVVDGHVPSPMLVKGYQRRGYHLVTGKYTVVMAKPLVPDASFHETYGDQFYISALQWF